LHLFGGEKLKEVKLFGKAIPVLAIVALAMSAGVASAAVVSYLSNTVTKSVTVESPIELWGEITYTYMPLAWTDVDDGVRAGLATDGEFLYMSFDVEETEESFLLVFMDTKEGGAPGGDLDGADYMIVDPFVNNNAFGGWYLGKWLTAEEREALGDVNPAPGWSEPQEYAEALNRPWNAWDCEGFVAEESRTDGVTHYEFRIPLEGIEFDAGHGLNILVQTGAGFGDWVTPEISVEEVTIEPFGGEPFATTLHGGDEFSMTFEAKNLANTPIEAPLALVIKGPAGTTWTMDEVKGGEPTPAFTGTFGEYYVAVYYGLGTIAPGATQELQVRVQFSEAIKPGDYELRAVVVWSDIIEEGEAGALTQESVEAILGAPGITA